MKKALLFDLDSSLIVTKSGETFPVDNDDWQFNRHVLLRIHPFILAGYGFFIVSNQGGIEAGFHKQQDIVDKMVAVLGEMTHALPMAESLTNAGYMFCPVMDKEDPARKPNPGMVYALRDAWKLDLKECLFVGDMESDKQCAQNAGTRYADIEYFLSGNITPETLALPLL